jgi:hypothetical protein
MADTNGYTKAKLKVVTSPIKPSRQNLNASRSTKDGVKPPTAVKDVTQEAEKMRDLLARMKDVTHNWPSRLPSGKMPLPLISNNHIIFAFPLGGHVIKNTVTSDGSQNFEVDGVSVIPVTSEEK